MVALESELFDTSEQPMENGVEWPVIEVTPNFYVPSRKTVFGEIVPDWSKVSAEKMRLIPGGAGTYGIRAAFAEMSALSGADNTRNSLRADLYDVLGNHERADDLRRVARERMTAGQARKRGIIATIFIGLASLGFVEGLPLLPKVLEIIQTLKP